jgi:hypothetical protein
MNHNPSRISGRGWAYLGAILGGVVSIAANVAHSYVPPSGAPADWSPQTGAVIGAIFWPSALFVAVEILARVAWPAAARWFALRFAGLLPVALVAAVVSYGHLSGLLAFYGESQWTAAIGPLAVDGLMVMATGALIATSAARTATVTADPVPVAVTVTPPAEVPAPVPVQPRPAPASARPKVTRRPPSADKVAKAAAKLPGASVAQVAAKAGVSESTARRYMPADRPAAGATVPSAFPLRPAPIPVPAAA